MTVEELERSDAVDLMRAKEELDLGPLWDSEYRVKPPHLGILVGDPLVGSDAVVVAPFDHERPWRNQRGHLRVVEGPAEVELRHLVFARVHVTVRVVDHD